MRSWVKFVLLCGLASLLLAPNGYAGTKDLQIYFVDVEGGQATLLVAPSGPSLLIDTGGRDQMIEMRTVSPRL